MEFDLGIGAVPGAPGLSRLDGCHRIAQSLFFGFIFTAFRHRCHLVVIRWSQIGDTNRDMSEEQGNQLRVWIGPEEVTDGSCSVLIESSLVHFVECFHCVFSESL